MEERASLCIDPLARLGPRRIRGKKPENTTGEVHGMAKKATWIDDQGLTTGTDRPGVPTPFAGH